MHRCCGRASSFSKTLRFYYTTSNILVVSYPFRGSAPWKRNKLNILRGGIYGRARNEYIYIHIIYISYLEHMYSPYIHSA